MKNLTATRLSRAPKGTRRAALALLAITAGIGCGDPPKPLHDRCAGVVCVAQDVCHVAGTCSPFTGTCDNPSADNGTACDDGNPCTQADSCQSGVCASGSPVACGGADECHTEATCDPATGMCSAPPDVPDGSPCTCGQCLTGVCRAKMLGPTGPSSSTPIRVAVDDDKLYFGNSGDVASATVAWLPKGGAENATLLTPKDVYVYLTDIVLFKHPTGNSIYFYSDDYVWHVPTMGGDVYGTSVVGSAPTSLATNNIEVYGTALNSGAVMVYPPGLAPIVVADSEAAPSRIVCDGINIYWINSGDQTIRKKTIPDGPVVTLAANQKNMADLAVDATHVYWTDFNAGTVSKVPIEGGVITTLASGQVPSAITVAGTMVYWSNGHSVEKTSTAGGQPVTSVGTSGGKITSLAHDEACLYWVERDFGTAWSAPL